MVDRPTRPRGGRVTGAQVRGKMRLHISDTGTNPVPVYLPMCKTNGTRGRTQLLWTQRILSLGRDTHSAVVDKRKADATEVPHDRKWGGNRNDGRRRSHIRHTDTEQTSGEHDCGGEQ